MKHPQKNRIVLLGMSLFAAAGLLGLVATTYHVPAAETPTVSAAADDKRQTKTEAVAGVQTTVTAPEGVDVNITPALSDPADVATKPTPKLTTNPMTPLPEPATSTPAQETPTSPAPAEPTPEPEPEVKPEPQEIVVNLKTPLTYKLKPGQKSPVLEHLMVDGVKYEWYPGMATSWKDEKPQATLPVWSTIELNRPSSPYISDRIPFTVEAAADAKPGEYTVQITVVLSPNVTMDIPVAVRVLPKDNEVRKSVTTPTTSADVTDTNRKQDQESTQEQP